MVWLSVGQKSDSPRSRRRASDVRKYFPFGLGLQHVSSGRLKR